MNKIKTVTLVLSPILLLFLFLYLNHDVALNKEVRTESFSIRTDDGFTRTFHLFDPRKFKMFPKKYPLMIVLHQVGKDSSEAMRNSGFDEVALNYKFFVAYPDGGNTKRGNRSWNTDECCFTSGKVLEDDVIFLNNMISEITDKYPIDLERIYISGVSASAVMAHRYACEGHYKISGILAVSGHGDKWGDCVYRKPISIISVIERDDSIYQENYNNFHHSGLKINGEEICSENFSKEISYRSEFLTVYTFTNICNEEIERVHYRIDGGNHGWHNVKFFKKDSSDSILWDVKKEIISKTDAELAWEVFSRTY